MLSVKVIPSKIENMPTIEVSLAEKRVYLYSKYNPSRDSRIFAEDLYREGSGLYLVYGLGLGYHIDALVDLIDRDDYHIHVFECNEDIIRIASDYLERKALDRNFTFHQMKNDSLHYGELARILAMDDISVGIHKPSMEAIPSQFKELKYLLEEFIMTSSSMEAMSAALDENFKENIGSFDDRVDSLFGKFEGKAIYIVSAGPSLDRNMGDLAKLGDGGIILSVGRAAKALLAMGIRPDYIILTDPSRHLYNNQLKGLEPDIPIIVLSTADKNIMKNYKGKRYIALQKGYPKAEELAEKLGAVLVRTGGSVATTALDIAIKMGGNPIVFVGQDLGFTDNKSHSSKARARNIVDSSGLRDVEDVYGNTIQTSKNLYIYLRWIQNRIEEEKNIEFIDATEGGARIRGTKVMRLKDLIK
ncbi:MAG: 6-hydroxymethylpterin diphosphokinase MptE-like protein [Tissierellaceae bacterium]